MSRPARVRLVLLAAVLLIAAGGLAFFFWPFGPDDEPLGPTVPTPDPRLTFDTPFRNARPGIDYVGDAACAVCHQKIDQTYHQHPMGRSAAVPTGPNRFETFDEASRVAFTAFGNVQYKVALRDGKIFQTEIVNGPDGKPVSEFEVEASVAIGSGELGRSYLCVRDGSVWQTGVSWFSSKKIWDASPGFTAGMHGQRPVLDGCLFCHMDRAELIPGTANRYTQPLIAKQGNVGCERCHGPGALHCAEQKAGTAPHGVDTSIVNPKHLAPDLRDSVCQQCHLQGEQRVPRRGRNVFEFRPGLPLELFQAVFVRHPDLTDYHKSVGQVEQLRISKCATASNGKMSCTSCHDPHMSPAPAAKAEFYRQKCLTCHTPQACVAPPAARQAKADACVACHMERTSSSNIAHTAITDHRILRKPRPGKGAAGLQFDDLPIVPFHKGAHGPDQAERDRDLGLALALAAREGEQVEPQTFGEAIARLKKSTALFSDDVEAWTALAILLSLKQDMAGAAGAAEKAVAAGPNHEIALRRGAEVAVLLRNFARARDLARRAVAVNPGNPENHSILGSALSEAGEWDEAETVLRDALKLGPANAAVRASLALCLYRKGDSRGGRQELERACAIDSRQAPMLREWYRNSTK